MKFQFFFGVLILCIAFSCSSNDEEFEENTNISITFSHYWDDEEITTDDYGTITFTNDSFNDLSIDNIKYVLSDVRLENSNNTEISIADVLFVKPIENYNTTINLSNFLIEDTYTLYFTFGLSDDNNISNSYTELDDENFNVPEEFGGGYFFMQLDGEFVDESDSITTYNYHMARAVEHIDTDSETIEDTSFVVNAGSFTVDSKNISVDIKVDLSQWFTDPNDWDLNELNSMLLQNYIAQLYMNQNGGSVFSIND